LNVLHGFISFFHLIQWSTYNFNFQEIYAFKYQVLNNYSII